MYPSIYHIFPLEIWRQIIAFMGKIDVDQMKIFTDAFGFNSKLFTNAFLEQCKSFDGNLVSDIENLEITCKYYCMPTIWDESLKWFPKKLLKLHVWHTEIKTEKFWEKILTGYCDRIKYVKMHYRIPRNFLKAECICMPVTLQRMNICLSYDENVELVPMPSVTDLTIEIIFIERPLDLSMLTPNATRLNIRWYDVLDNTIKLSSKITDCNVYHIGKGIIDFFDAQSLKNLSYDQGEHAYVSQTTPMNSLVMEMNAVNVLSNWNTLQSLSLSNSHISVGKITSLPNCITKLIIENMYDGDCFDVKLPSSLIELNLSIPVAKRSGTNLSTYFGQKYFDGFPFGLKILNLGFIKGWYLDKNFVDMLPSSLDKLFLVCNNCDSCLEFDDLIKKFPNVKIQNSVLN
jgi:hypothetical protein